jgi:predicted ATP-grasp superfamily ATP-dependent carboligase
VPGVATRERSAPAVGGRAPLSEPPAIVFGDDVSGLAVLRSFGRNGIPVFMATEPSPNVARSRWYKPATEQPIEEPADARRLAAYLRELPIPEAVLIPASDEWALALASLPPGLAESYPAAVAPRRVVQTLIDKQRFASIAEELGVPAPRTVFVRGVEDLDAVSESELPNFFLKPVSSQAFARRFGVKGLRLDQRDDAAELVRKVARERLEVVLQEFIPGPPTNHVFLDGYVDSSGAVQACLARRRLRMHPADFGNSTLSVTIPLDEVAPAVESLHRLFNGVGFRGFFDAEFKQDERDGVFKIFEVNARPWWQLELCGACGLDVCGMAYRDALGQPVGSAPDYRIGRTWVHPVPDFKAWWEGRHKGGTAGGFPMRNWLGGANALFTPDDPMPGFEQFKVSVRNAARRLRAR